MLWERVTEEIFLFTSDRYALVNCVAIMTDEGIVMVDALPFPDEARQIARFLDQRSGGHFHSLVLTHYHMDHVYGFYAFPQDLGLIAHERCQQKLLETGEASLAQARANDPAFEEVRLRLPTMTFAEGELVLKTGNKTLRLMHLPGHTPDNIGVFLEEDRVLIAGDAVMAIPIVADGNWEQEVQTLQAIKALSPETIIQGHGEVILRGEIQDVLDKYIRYVECVHKKASKALKDGRQRKELWKIPLEACGLERVPLGIASHQLHVANMLSIYDQLRTQTQGR